MKANKDFTRQTYRKPGVRCPACGSIRIYLWMGANLGMIYKCNECGYTGPVVIEEDK